MYVRPFNLCSVTSIHTSRSPHKDPYPFCEPKPYLPCNNNVSVVYFQIGVYGFIFSSALNKSKLFEVEMSKKCTPLWREARLEVKMLELPDVRATYGRPEVIQTSKKCTWLWREAHFQVKSAKNCRW